MNGARVVHLPGVTVRVRDSADVNADECGFCTMTASDAVAELRRRLNARESVTCCSGCTEALALEVTRQLRTRRAS